MEGSTKIALDLTTLKKAINSMDAILKLALDNDNMSKQNLIVRNAVRSGLIQHFEFTYELCWKFMQGWLENNRTLTNGISRKELFRYAAEELLIEDTQKWFSYAEARNLTVHTYDITTSDKVFSTATIFLDDAKKFLKVLEEKND